METGDDDQATFVWLKELFLVLEVLRVETTAISVLPFDGTDGKFTVKVVFAFPAVFPVADCKLLLCPATFPAINMQSKASSINLPVGVNVFILSGREVIRLCPKKTDRFRLLQTVKLFIFNYFTND